MDWAAERLLSLRPWWWRGWHVDHTDSGRVNLCPFTGKAEAKMLFFLLDIN